MGHSYTPGLRVAKLTQITKERRLPLTGEVLVKKGDKVSAEQVIARTELPGNVHPVNCAGQLGILPADIAEALTVEQGAEITKGQVIALAKSFFGLFKSTLESPIDGVLESASPVTGQLMKQKPPIPVEVAAYIDGEVTDYFEGEGVEITTVGAEIQGIFGIGGERSGIIYVVVADQNKIMDEAEVPADAKGKIIVAGSRVTLAGFKKAMEAGAVAVVTGGFFNEDLKALLGYEQGVAITGHEEMNASLILTEGFGEIAMAKRTFDLLKANEGRRASVSGATQIRAGVIRPEVIIPSDEKLETAAKASEGGGLEIGDLVRIIREPKFGAIGSVTDLPSELQQLETGAKVRVLEMDLGDGEKFILPRANVEIIEG